VRSESHFEFRMTIGACQLTPKFAGTTVSPMADSEYVHPGVLVRQQCLERFDLSVTQAAAVLGVSRQALTNLLGGKAGISPEMALRLAKAFGMSAETWLQRQVLYDLETARKRFPELDVVQIVSEMQSTLF
jgi:antitoxin HigA-1